MSPLGWWVAIGLVPQFFFWIWFTIAFGALFGIVTAAIARRRGRLDSRTRVAIDARLGCFVTSPDQAAVSA
jgi:hypothetical protein